MCTAHDDTTDRSTGQGVDGAWRMPAPLAELRQALFDLLMEVIDVAPAPQGVIELPGYSGFTAALIEDTQIVFRPQTGIPGIARVLVDRLPQSLERQRILRRLVQGLAPKVIQIKAIVARHGRDDRGLEIGQPACPGWWHTARIAPGRTGSAR